MTVGIELRSEKSGYELTGVDCNGTKQPILNGTKQPILKIGQNSRF